MEALPGLQDFGAEAGAEFSRLGTQGAMELAGALFGGAAFTAYGPGQYTPSQEQESILQGPKPEELQPEQGREM
jgi:hypothetical protein